jgi:hypothetical protein
MVVLRTSFSNEWLQDWFKTQVVTIGDIYSTILKKYAQ